MAEKSNDFNFKKPVIESSNLQEYLRAKEDAVKSKMYGQLRQRSGSNQTWIIVFILLLTLIGLGTYGLIQWRQTNETIAQLKKQSEVAGVIQEENVNNIVPGDGFSLVLNQNTPNGFKKQRRVEDFSYLPEKKSVITSLLSQDTRDEVKLLSGIEVAVSEYDNRLSRKDFEGRVLDKLGKEFAIKSRDITLPKDIKATKIEQENDPENVAYYVTVTTENYYVIKIYNQASEVEDLAPKSQFTSNLLPSLYLN